LSAKSLTIAFRHAYSDPSGAIDPDERFIQDHHIRRFTVPVLQLFLDAVPLTLSKVSDHDRHRDGRHTIFFAIWNGISDHYDMKTIVSMDSSGRLVIPKNVRQALNAPRKAVFEAEVLGNRLELTLTEAPPARLRRKGKLLIVPKQGIASDAVKAVEATRRERR